MDAGREDEVLGAAASAQSAHGAARSTGADRAGRTGVQVGERLGVSMAKLASAAAGQTSFGRRAGVRRHFRQAAAGTRSRQSGSKFETGLNQKQKQNW